MTLKVGIYLPNFAYDRDDGIDHADRLRYWITESEAAGIESIWVTDHLLRASNMYGRTWIEPIVSLSFAASLTRRVLLGPGVLLLPLREPVLLAKMVASLQQLSNGRFIFGVGTGWYPGEFEAVGRRREDRGALTDEVLEVVRRLLAGGQVSHEGRFYSFTDVCVEPSPMPLPVWVGGGSQIAHPGSVEQPRLAKTVARRIASSDGWFVRPTAEAEQIVDDWERLQPYIAEAGRRPEDIEVGHGQLLHLTREDRREQALDEQHRVAQRVLGTHRSREQLERSYLFGTLDEVVANCARRVGAGVEHLILHPLTDDPDQLDLWVKELFPKLRALPVTRRSQASDPATA
ncbi:MAG: LLM class flavin-dependent oxidoreductase [Candidatus Limnocylindria bacterium]